MWSRFWCILPLVVAGLAPAVHSAPFPAHLVVHKPVGAHPVMWQEFPIAHKPANSAAFRPILPGTDRGLYNEGFFEGDIVKPPTEEHMATVPDTKNAVTDAKLLWPYGTVVFKVDDDVGCPESPQCSILMSAMEHYHENSCIRFKEWTGEANFVTIFFNTDSSGACWSPVGRVGTGEQRLSLGQRCWYRGIVIHELGHAIGFWHEMNRPDRDDWIYVYWHNIIPGFSSAFRKHDPRTVATLGEKFDYRSIMMYDEYAFSKDGRSATLQAVTGEEIGPIWRKRGLSASDRRRVQKLYKCDPRSPKPGFPYDVSCDFNQHTCGFKNGGSPVWNWRTVNQTDGYVYTSFASAGTKPGHFVSVNYHPISQQMEKTRGPLGCARFYYLMQGDGDIQLKLEQAYLKKATQINHDESTTYELWSNATASNEWIHMEIPLYVTRPFRLIFTSQFNDTVTHGIIAMDDVELFYHPCNPTSETTESSTKPVPSPAKPTFPPMTSSSTTSSSTTTSTTTTAAPTTTTTEATTLSPTTSETDAMETTSSDVTGITDATPTDMTDVTNTPEATGATSTTEMTPESSSTTEITTTTPTANTDSTESTSSEPASDTITTTSTASTTGSTLSPDEQMQLLQLQQQHQIWEQQQILEQEQQKVQQQQLLDMQQGFPQWASKPSLSSTPSRPSLHQQEQVTLVSTAPDPDTQDPESENVHTTFPTYETVPTATSQPGDSSTPFSFPISLSDKGENPEIPNVPIPTDQMPMNNPNPPSSTTPYESDYS